MGTAINPASPRWRILYEAAVLELDREKLELRIAEAERELTSRMQELRQANDGSESEVLINALNVLRDLRKMAAEKPAIGERVQTAPSSSDPSIEEN